MGTTQIFTALAERYDYFKTRTYKVALIAPCTITDPSMYVGFNLLTEKIIDSLDVYAIGGPYWYLDIVRIRDLIGLKGTRDFLLGGWGTALVDISVKSIDHYAQNSESMRFQKYSDSYWLPKPFG